jgi:hypothetical protein
MVSSYDLNKTEIEEYQLGDADFQTCGMGHHDEGVVRLGQAFDRTFSGFDQVTSADASGWDLSVSRGHILFDAFYRVLRAKSDTNDVTRVHTMLLNADAFVNSAHVLMLGGNLVRAERYGQTASGLPNTTSQNNHMRGAAIRVAGARRAITAGDDVLIGGDVDPMVLLSHGTITKPVTVTPASGPLTFTSHDFTRVCGKWNAEFLGLEKCLTRLLIQTSAPTQMQLGGVFFAVRHTPAALGVLQEVCKTLGWQVPSSVDWVPDPEV